MFRALRVKRCGRHDMDFELSLIQISTLERLMSAYMGKPAFDGYW